LYGIFDEIEYLMGVAASHDFFDEMRNFETDIIILHNMCLMPGKWSLGVPEIYIYA